MRNLELGIVAVSNASHLGIGWSSRMEGKKRKRRKHGIYIKEGRMGGRERKKWCLCECSRGVKDVREAKMGDDWHWEKSSTLISPRLLLFLY